MIGLLCLNATAAADKAPLSAEGLQNEADLVVAATIEKIRIETEVSQFEGAGNWDWGIYLTLRVESIEKGTSRARHSRRNASGSNRDEVHMSTLLLPDIIPFQKRERA